MQVSKSLESYAHKAAKEVMVGWLREAAALAIEECPAVPYTNMAGISWRVNRDAPHYGVWLEYPIGKAQGYYTSRDGYQPVWDETDEGKWRERPPTFDELKEQGRTPEYILDIAIQHKGSIVGAIEIVHKNPPSKAKISALRQLCSDVLVIPASWVLGQVGVPTEIPDRFYRTETPRQQRARLERILRRK